MADQDRERTSSSNEPAVPVQSGVPPSLPPLSRRRDLDLLSRVLDTAPVGFMLIDPNGTVSFVNATLRERIGHDPVGRRYEDAMPTLTDHDGRLVALEQRPFQRVMATRAPVRDCRLALGPTLLLIQAAPLLDAGGSIDAVVVVVEDVTDRFQAERQQQQYLQDVEFLSRTAIGFLALGPEVDLYRHVGDLLVEILGDAIVSVASQEASGGVFRVRYLSRFQPELEALLGRPLGEIEISALPGVHPPVASGRLVRLDCGLYEIVEQVLSPEVAHAAARLVGAHDVHVMGLFGASGLLGSVGILVPRGVRIPRVGLVEAFVNQAAVAIGRRSSDDRLRAAEGWLVHSQRLETVGALAGSLTHDLNNLLGVILGTAGLLRAKAGASRDLARYAELIETEAQRSGALLRQLLGLTRRDPVRSDPVDVHEVLFEVEQMLEPSFGSAITVSLDLAAPRSVILGDAGQLEQVFLNLAMNARDAMPAGGTLRIVTRAEGEADLVVSVIDTGTGMSDGVRAHLFEPFYTTKAPGRGTGMGLHASQSIVRAHGGRIDVQSVVDSGTTFHVCLPLAEDADAPQRITLSAIARGVERILLVETDLSLRVAVTAMLGELGYRPHAVADPRQAAEYFRLHQAEIDLVLLDLPNGDPEALAGCEEIMRIDPLARVIVTSVGSRPEELGRLGVRGWLCKPYGLHALSEAVVGALSS